jgi:hypothetical protein
MCILELLSPAGRDYISELSLPITDFEKEK